MYPFCKPVISEYVCPRAMNSFPADASGAFFGAFFAFLFGIGAYHIQKMFDRYRKHRNSIVELEHLLLEHFEINASNQYLLKGAVRTMREDLLSFTLLNSFRLPEALTLKFGNLEILNKYLTYTTSVSRLNHSMISWQKMSDQQYQAAISGSLSPVSRAANHRHLTEQATEIIKFLLGLEEETKELSAYARVFLRKDKKIWSLFFIEKSGKPVVSVEEITKEREVLEREMLVLGEESRQRIDKIHQKEIDITA